MRYKVAIRFAVEGDLRFISHHDMMRLFERAFSRAQLPIRFSEGFNPRPRLSLPLPRAVGVATEVDVLVVELEEPMEPDVFRDRLAAQMPSGLSLMDTHLLSPGQSLEAQSVGYAVSVPRESMGRVEEALGRLLAAEVWTIDRRRRDGGPTTRIDLRGYLLEARLERDVLQWTVRAGNTGSLRPAELLEAVGLDPAAIHHRVRRILVQWNSLPPVFGSGMRAARVCHEPAVIPG